MQARPAFELICEVVAASPRRRVVETFFDEKHFGNFLVAFTEDDAERCIINDRDFLTLTPDLNGRGASIATVPSLYELDGEALLKGLSL